jgi:uncharacterized protein YdiU (UPF0061 family)
MKTLTQLTFNNTFAALPADFYRQVAPTPLSDPYLISFSQSAADLLDIDPNEFQHPFTAELFSGVKSLPDMQPLAALYAGHQFGHYVPQLGDGRAILLGEAVNERGEHWELQLKGAGQTPYSRDGDGRAVLRSSIREYLCSEAMAGLGIPTTRALCLVGSDEEVYREQIETGAMVLRMAPSFVRFGSFEVFFYRRQHDQLRILADYVIQHDYPGLADAETPYLALLEKVIERTAKLVAQWQLVGFAHGVLNTDNMSVLGLTLDYGPFGFLDAYDPDFICNHSDYQGRYAFDRQPNMGLWNLSCFAQALLPLLDVSGEAAAEKAKSALQGYQGIFVDAFAQGMRAKLGLSEAKEKDQQLSADLLGAMQKNQVDYTLLFRNLGQLKVAFEHPRQDAAMRDLFLDQAAFDRWAIDYRARLRAENRQDTARQTRMNQANPKYVLRNYLAQQAIAKAERKDFSEVNRLLKALSNPYAEDPENADLAALPPDWAGKIEVSCSS